MDISKRLQAVAAMVTKGRRLADIGTDHGYIPIYLLENHKISGAIAMDINKGPLERAKQNITAYGYDDVVETRLSDGLSRLSPGEADSLLMAGMGGKLMIRILEDGKATAQAAEELILQPQSHVADVRRYLHASGYQIAAENMLIDEGKFYVMMKAVHGQEHYEEEVFYLYGKCLLQEQNQTLLKFLEKEASVKQSIYENLAGSDSVAGQQKALILKEELEQISKALTYYSK